VRYSAGACYGARQVWGWVTQLQQGRGNIRRWAGSRQGLKRSYVAVGEFLRRNSKLTHHVTGSSLSITLIPFVMVTTRYNCRNRRQ
jgi:hypothetical protein